MNGLDLFSGIGGISLALKSVVKPIAYCENDRYAQSVLFSRMASGELPVAPVWDDVRTLGLGVIGSAGAVVDIITGGFPCQDISVAGNGKGLAGERSGLFFEIVRLAGELRPKFIFLENVPAITVRGLDRVLLELTSLGYDCRWTILSAAEVGAPHLRERWFLLANANGEHGGNEREDMVRGNASVGERKAIVSHHGFAWDVADSSGAGSQGPGNVSGAPSNAQARQSMFCGIGDKWQWSVEPNVGRVANGVPHRVDRLRGLGNAVVPLQTWVAFQRLAGIE